MYEKLVTIKTKRCLEFTCPDCGHSKVTTINLTPGGIVICNNCGAGFTIEKIEAE